MTIRKKKNHNLEHLRSVNALKRAGLVGLLITGDGKQAITSWLGQYEKAMADVYKIMVENPMLKQIAKAVAQTVVTAEATQQRVLAPELRKQIDDILYEADANSTFFKEEDATSQRIYDLILDQTFGEKIIQDSVVSIEETEPQNIENETV